MSCFVRSTGLDTSDATATEARILNGYTAYAKGQKITGTYVAKQRKDVDFVDVTDGVCFSYKASTSVCTVMSRGSSWMGVCGSYNNFIYTASVAVKVYKASVGTSTETFQADGSLAAGQSKQDMSRGYAYVFMSSSPY